MVLKQFTDARLLKKAQEREQHLSEMQGILQAAKKENRAFTDDENSKFDNLEKQLKDIDSELERNNTSAEELEKQIAERELRYQKSMKKDGAAAQKTEIRSLNPLEVRSYKKGQQLGKGSKDVTLGDFIVAHTTGKFRNEEVRNLLTTNSGGVTISEEVFAGFIDLLRDTSFLGEFTTYTMNAKTLTIPRVNGDVVPHFKLEATEITPSAPVFVGANLEAKFLYCLTEISLELLESSAIDIGEAVNNIMAASMMASIQKYALSGAVNGYAGIFNDAAITKIPEALSYATIGAGIQSVQAVNGMANSLLINPADMMNLQLLTETGGQFITPPSFLDNVNIIPSNSIAQGQALVGDLTSVAMGVLSQNGLQLDISKDAGFSRGVVHVRARFSGDVVLTNPKQLALVGTVEA